LATVRVAVLAASIDPAWGTVVRRLYQVRSVTGPAAVWEALIAPQPCQDKLVIVPVADSAASIVLQPCLDKSAIDPVVSAISIDPPHFRESGTDRGVDWEASIVPVWVMVVYQLFPARLETDRVADWEGSTALVSAMEV